MSILDNVLETDNAPLLFLDLDDFDEEGLTDTELADVFEQDKLIPLFSLFDTLDADLTLPLLPLPRGGEFVLELKLSSLCDLFLLLVESVCNNVLDLELPELDRLRRCVENSVELSDEFAFKF
jgi:hypothetical protein